MPSFDIRPTPKRVASRTVTKASAPMGEMRAPVRTKPLTRRESNRPQTSKVVKPLRTRRKDRRRKSFYLILVAFLILLAGAVVLLWQPFLRVQQVVVQGPGSDVLPQFIQTQLQGTEFVVIPRNSIFFLPTQSIRTEVLQNYPNIEAVSLSASGLTTLSVSTIGRARAFWWCGTIRTETPTSCLETDPQGKIFKVVDPALIASSTSEFIVYSEVSSTTSTGDVVLGASVTGAKYIPELLRFAKTLKSLGANVTSVQLRGDEADLYTVYGTRITYVLGREQQAATLAATAFPSLTLSNNSLLYVDLRFDSKIFFKKRESEVVGGKSPIR